LVLGNHCFFAVLW